MFPTLSCISWIGLVVTSLWRSVLDYETHRSPLEKASTPVIFEYWWSWSESFLDLVYLLRFGCQKAHLKSVLGLVFQICGLDAVRAIDLACAFEMILWIVATKGMFFSVRVMSFV